MPTLSRIDANNSDAEVATCCDLLQLLQEAAFAFAEKGEGPPPARWYCVSVLAALVRNTLVKIECADDMDQGNVA